MASFKWDQAKIDKAVSLLKDGLSAAEIGRVLGCSRNAVLGKMFRMGLNFQGHSASATKKRIERRKLRAQQQYQQRQAKRPPVFMSLGNRITIPVDPAPLPIPPASDVARVKLVDLEFHHCRWPVHETTDENFGFCGLKKVTGTSYCHGHMARANVPIQTRTKRERATEDAARLRQDQKQKVEA